MEKPKFKYLTQKQKAIIFALHKSELTSRQIAEGVHCSQTTVIRQLQKFEDYGLLPITKCRKPRRYREGPLPKRITLSITYKHGDRPHGGIAEIMKKPPHEQLKYYHKQVTRLSNMMEVKHSPSSQMDFRNTTNGLPSNEEEDEEMDTLLDGGTIKSIPSSGLECDSTPILNGNNKYSALEDGMEIDLLDDDMDEELNTTVSDSENKHKHQETESQNGDVNLFDLNLETAVVTEEKITNGETTALSNVRDAGDDLDTLLSKINDLVEDCMEPAASVDSSTKKGRGVAVQIEVEAEDAIVDKAKETQENSSDELGEMIELEEVVGTEADEQNEFEILSEVKEEEQIEYEIEIGKELLSDEVSHIKSTPDLLEDVSEENVVELAENDFEIVEEEAPREIEEEIPECGAEEIPEEVELEEVELEEVVDEIIPAAETADEIIPAAETVEEEVITEIVNETVVEVVVEEAAEEITHMSKEITTEGMNIDEDIVCLDSPMPEENEEENLSSAEPDVKSSVPSPKDSVPAAVGEEKPKQTETGLKDIPVENEVLDVVSSKQVTPDESVTKKGNGSLKTMEEDDEIFLIEDDDESMKKLSKKEEILEEKIREDAKLEDEEKENEKKTEEVSKKTPSETKEVDDDDIVCLDDSFEETEDPKESKKDEEKLSETSSQKLLDDKVVRDVDLRKSIIKEGNEVDKDEQKKSEDTTLEIIAGHNMVEEIVQVEIKTPVEKGDERDSSVKNSEKAGASLEQGMEDGEPSQKVIKPTEEVVAPVSSTISETEISVSKEISQATPESATISKVNSDNDIINLDDDDEDDAAPSTEKKDEKSSAEVLANKSLALLSDNSDNARDGVEEKDDKNEPKESTEKSIPMQSETNSNSNSSSNLLKESNITERDESPSEPTEQPPAKRIRLSQDEASSRNSNASQDDTSSKLLDDDDVLEVLDNDVDENKTLKRVHSTESVSSDFKKPKTDIDSSKFEEEKQPELLEEIIPAKVEPLKSEEKLEKKPSDVKPLPLYPPPNFDAPKIGLSLDFLRRFKKSIHKMNKSDLEELVLQKIVEAIVHKSEFSEMRELIEKQEKIITGHRSKITELNKQFRDLEMVHNRVLKDLETKNSQFIMPVKITRAVGLQVFFPNKKYDQPMASLPSASSVQSPSASSLARSVSTSSSTSSIPEKAPTSNPTNVNSLASQASSLPTAPGGNNQQRRGCVQKLTPMRPDGPRSTILNRGVTAGVVSSSTPSPITPKDNAPKLLNRQISPKARLSQSPMGVNVSNSSLPQQAHSIHPLTTQPDAERPKTLTIPQGIATKKTSGPAKNFPPSKRIPKSWQSEQSVPAQSLPTTAPTASSQMVPPQSSILNSALAPKTQNKSVIDLTDEDDVAPTPSSKPPNVVAAPQKSVNNAAINRVGPYKVSVIPAAQLQQQPRPNPTKANPPRAQNPPILAPKPNGTAQNTVRRTPPPTHQRFRHPAPLPNQPIHSSNPMWKLPPARPTIRISNLDSGIVISWTIEDMAKEKYAESTSYQIYAYQETSGPPLVESWRHVGDVKAMLLPMAVTLTQFQEGQRYYFAVRAVDAHNRCGPFSFAKTWS